MQKLIASVLLAATITAQAAPPIITDIDADYQQTQELQDQSFVKGAGVPLQYRVKIRGKWSSLVGQGARWEGRSSSTSTQALQSVGVAITNTTPNYFQIDLDSDQTGTSVTNWVYSLIVTEGGIDYPLGRGRLDIDESTWTGASAILSTVTAQSYTDGAIADHAAVAATTNSLGHIIVGGGLAIDTNGVLSTSAGGGTVTEVTASGIATATGGPTVYNISVTTGDVQNAEADAIALAALNSYTVTGGDTNYATAAQGLLADSALQAEADTLATVLARGNDADGNVISNTPSINDASAVIAVDITNRYLKDENNISSVRWHDRYTEDTVGNKSIDWQLRKLYGGSFNETIDYGTRDFSGAWTFDTATTGVDPTATNHFVTVSYANDNYSGAWQTNQVTTTSATIELDGTALNYKITPAASTTITLASAYPHGREVAITYYGTNSITWPVEYTLLKSAQEMTMTGTNLFTTMYQGGTNYNVIGVAQ